MHVSGNNMNMEIIIMGHGHFASGLYSTLELIGGEQEHVAWIDFTEDKDMDGLLEELKETADKMSECDNVLIACDLDGGTPYKTALLYSMQHQDVEIVTGISFPFLLELSLTRDIVDDMDTLLETTMNSARTAMKRFDLSQMGM